MLPTHFWTDDNTKMQNVKINCPKSFPKLIERGRPSSSCPDSRGIARAVTPWSPSVLYSNWKSVSEGRWGKPPGEESFTNPQFPAFSKVFLTCMFQLSKTFLVFPLGLYCCSSHDVCRQSVPLFQQSPPHPSPYHVLFWTLGKRKCKCRYVCRK